MNKEKNPIKEGFYVAGAKFHNLDLVIDLIEEGDELEMVPEPDNEYDPNAIKLVYHDDIHEDVMVGYIPSKLTKYIHPILNESFCEVVSVNPSAKPWNQLKVRIG